MKNILRLVVFSIALQACGQTGPLYHPDEKAPIFVPEDQYENEEENQE
ncbi:MAG: lipoprotein [Methylococcales symbiont of Hymedesmia sp. n. MRB-2018]|nr:MAG: lipoprotein [Methylococcales symbiont of Hymedesmia sp. n. MRB-2018]KAF3983274.1 MAG: lipoprotein [Methylococcales symbiont of Hymedesmia sp. n. MRB-2018]